MQAQVGLKCDSHGSKESVRTCVYVNNGSSCGLQHPSVIRQLSSALLPSQSADIMFHTHTFSVSPFYTHYFDSVPPWVWVARETHTVSPQRSLINEMVCSLPQTSANQARGHKSLPTGDTEGHRPLFIGNLSPNCPDRESNTLAQADTTNVSACVCFSCAPSQICYRKYDGRHIINISITTMK